MIAPILAALIIVILAAKASGWISVRLGQPAVLGELLVGLVLGPSALGVFELPYFAQADITELLVELGEIGVILLMFVAGMDVHLEDMIKTGKPALLAGTLGVLAPIVLTVGVVVGLGYGPTQSIFLGLVLAATSVSISAQTLIELGVLRSREGIAMLGAAVVDDVLSLLLLSVFAALVVNSGGGALGVAGIVLRMVAFLVVALMVAIRLLPSLPARLARLPLSEPIVTGAVVVMLIFAWTAQELGGIAAITGAFLAGVGMSRSPQNDAIRRGTHVLAYAFFVPIFLVSIGLRADVGELTTAAAILILALTAVAVISKVLGAGAGARLGGLTGNESLRLGVGMISRGEVGLIVANVGLTLALISTELFTDIVLVVLATTLLAPPLLKLTYRRKEATDA
jgi:Kef-type K+ transport system membrane component KefB